MSMNTVLKHVITWCAGAVCGALCVYAISYPVAQKMLAGETQMSEQIQDIYSQGTILREMPIEEVTHSAAEIPLLNGFATLRIRGVDVPSQTLSPGKTWYIPMKVKPEFYGDATRAQIFYLDIKTHQLTGPFAPGALPQ